MEEPSRVKKARAPDYPENNIDYNDEDGNQFNTEKLPPGFLSQAVLDDLELDRSIPGRPGSDYPILGSVPYTNFYCDDQRFPGFYADEETRCQTWHYCDIDGRQTTFLCPNGTQFSQVVLVCDWWFNVECKLSSKLYVINSRLYGVPKDNKVQPHRTLTLQLLKEIFNDEATKSDVVNEKPQTTRTTPFIIEN